MNRQKQQQRRPPRQKHMRFYMQTNYLSLSDGGHPKFETLQCVFCKEEKPLKEFSEMQVAKACFNLHAPASTKDNLKLISCLKCTALPRETLTCHKCTKTKPLGQFARAQRRNAERPRCLKCMKKHIDEDVNDSEPDYSSDDGSSLSDTWVDYL